MPSTAKVAMLAAIPPSRMIGTPTTNATRDARSAEAIADGMAGYCRSARMAGRCSWKLFFNTGRVNHAVA